MGPKLAITILSGMSVQDLIRAVGYEDVSSLVKIPGVGKKTAERLVVELKDRLAKLTLTQPNEALTLPVVSATDGSTIIPINDTREEALSALVALGYKAPVASKIIQSVYDDTMSSEQLIRAALKAMV